MVQIPSACTCPHCSSTNFRKHGTDRNIQRYYCKSCCKTFKETTKTPIHGLHKKNKVAVYLQALKIGMSVRKAAKVSGLSKNTAFAWRHKFLSSLTAQTIVRNAGSTIALKLIETPYSNKGRKKQSDVEKEMSRTILMVEGKQLKLQKLMNKKVVKDLYLKLTDNQLSNCLVFIPHRIITRALSMTEKVTVQNKCIKTSLQKTLSEHETELIAWMSRFKGVATKYLQQYWNWYSVLNNIRMLKNDTQQFEQNCVNSRSIDNYREMRAL